MAHRPAAFLFEAILLSLALLALGEPWRCLADPQFVARQPARGLVPHLEIDRRAGDSVNRLQVGAQVRSGDVVQVSYIAAGNRFGVVVSVDGRGAVTLHHPRAAHEVPRIKARGETPLPHAFELDDAPGFERFFFVTGARVSLDPSSVLEAAHALAADGIVASRYEPLPLPAELGQSSFLLRKSR
ncbi:MAG: hypothetical protein ACRBN8_11200 [Nannocystales bacterium]